jgi:protein gp37
MAYRFSGRGLPYEGLVKLSKKGEPRWTGVLRFVAKKLVEPLKEKEPRRIFVNSMSDLFHEDVADDEISAVFGVMAACPQHTFQILTKRAARMHEWFAKQNVAAVIDRNANLADDALLPFMSRAQRAAVLAPGRGLQTWPLANVWLGVSVESQRYADERIPLLLDTPAAVRWVSAEPLLELTRLHRFMWPVHSSWPSRFRSPEEAIAAGATVHRHRQALVGAHCRFLNWVVCGGESGPGARPFHLEWARSLVTECREAGVAAFVKQMGDAPFLDGKPLKLSRKGKDMAEWPEDLRVRMMPGEKWS